MIFVDTSAWFASHVPGETVHAQAHGFYSAATMSFITTDYVIDELLTLMKARGEAKRAVDLGTLLFAESLASIEWLTSDDVLRAWQIFMKFRDKDWSFTDCTSYVVMQRLGIKTAFAFDEHFRQFGTVTVMPWPDFRWTSFEPAVL